MSTDVHTFTGARVPQDPESKYTANGKLRAKFSLGLGRKDPSGQPTSIYPNFVAYGDAAQAVMDTIHKGSTVNVVKSFLSIYTYTGQDNVKRTVTEYVITSPSDFEVVDTSEAQTTQQYQPPTGKPQTPRPAPSTQVWQSSKGPNPAPTNVQTPTRRAVANNTMFEPEPDELGGYI